MCGGPGKGDAAPQVRVAEQQVRVAARQVRGGRRRLGARGEGGGGGRACGAG